MAAIVSRAGAIEFEIRVWSPISMVVDSMIAVTMDDCGLVVRIDQSLNRNSVRHADRTLPVQLEPLRLVTVERTNDTVVQETIDHRRATVTVRTYRLSGDHIEWQADGLIRVVRTEQPGNYDVLLDEDLVITSRIGTRSMEYSYNASDASLTYSWGDGAPFLSVTEEHPHSRWTAYGTYDAGTDTLTIVHPIEDDPSPYQARYEITNARALLRQRFTPTAAALNNWIVPSDRLVYLRPLFTVGGLME